MTPEMNKLRKLLDEEGIDWHDASDKASGLYRIDRTHFKHRGYSWSIIHGYGSYGEEHGKLELMSNAVNKGDPVGWLTAEECMAYVKGD